jgi:hypothetical protein
MLELKYLIPSASLDFKPFDQFKKQIYTNSISITFIVFNEERWLLCNYRAIPIFALIDLLTYKINWGQLKYVSNIHNDY